MKTKSSLLSQCRPPLTLAYSLLLTLAAPALSQVSTSVTTDSLAGNAEKYYASRDYSRAATGYKELADQSKDSSTRQKWRFLYADSLCQLGQWARAKSVYNEFAASTKVDKELKYQALLSVAGCSFHEEHFPEAERELAKCTELLSELKLTSQERSRRTILLLLYQGESFYRQERYDEASKLFVKALDILAGQNLGGSLDYENSKMLLESLSGCFQHLHQFDKAEPILRTMAILDKNYLGDSDLTYGWSLLGLSDVLKALHRPDEAQPLYRKAIWTFRFDNRNRIAKDLGISEEQLSRLKESDSETYKKKAQLYEKLTRDVFGQGFGARELDKNLEPPGFQSNLFDRCQAHLPGEKLGAWNLRPQRFTEAPGWVWSDPGTEQKAMIVCVHGLGLHHKAYESFAQRMAREGFIVVSFDVRGFGVFTQARGHDKLDMQGCVSDLINVIKELKQDYPKIPVFLLGESMGGALALRVAAADPQCLEGLVCSVPAGNRHSEAGTKLKVAMKLISNTKKPVYIGKTVVNQSTKDPEQRSQWVEDPNSRLRLSAQELLQFELFMRQNKEVARRIEHTPVLVFQGNQDRLVKREGTYDLFEALKTNDKTMVLLGNREHLIFEANPFKDDITLGVIGWLNAHARPEHGCE